MVRRRRSEAETREDPGDGGDELAGGLKSFGGLPGAGLSGRAKRVFQLVPPPAQRVESSQARTELGADRFFDSIVTARGGGAHAGDPEQARDNDTTRATAESAATDLGKSLSAAIIGAGPACPFSVVLFHGRPGRVADAIGAAGVAGPQRPDAHGTA